MNGRIEASGVALAGRNARLTAFDFSAGPGIHAIVGSASDGAAAALALFAGALRPSRGVVSVGGGDPTRSSKRIAWVPRDAPRADPLSVRASIALAADLRGRTGASSGASPSKSADAVLAPFGLVGLADRRVASLSPGEALAVSLAVALASESSFVLLEEPFAGLDVTISHVLAEQIETCAKSGACVVVATASRREAVRLGAHVHRLVRGVSMDGAHATASSLSFVVTASDTRALAAALASDASVRLDAPAGADSTFASLRLHAPDAHAASLAIGRAAEQAGVDISSIEADES